jgi:hyperosmotically inducible periplasmic protein
MEAIKSKIPAFLLTSALLITPGFALAENATDVNASSSPSTSSDASAVKPDNTGKNVRDRSDNALTPLSASNDSADVETTRKIRRALMDDKSLSTTAKNVKVITVDGKVTLRGPVKSEQEKIAVADQAQRIAGPGKVNDQLEVSAR